jgi:hypothetical protein
MPPILENPDVWVGNEKGRDDVAQVINPGTPQEQVIRFAPAAALMVAAQLVKYAERLIRSQNDAVARHARNIEKSEQQAPSFRKLDS